LKAAGSSSPIFKLFFISITCNVEIIVINPAGDAPGIDVDPETEADTLEATAVVTLVAIAVVTVFCITDCTDCIVS